MSKFTKMRAAIGTDESLARDGAWLVLDESAGVRWKIRSVHTRAMQKAQHEIALRMADGVAGGTDFDASLSSDHEMIVALVSDWAGMREDDGSASLFTPENVAAALEAFPEWRGRVLAFARNPKNHRLPTARALGVMEGNSGRASAAA